MDPLAPYGRQDPCWCGSGKTYRLCHKRWAAPASLPNAPVPEDPEEGTYLSPSVLLDHAAIDTMLPAGGAPIYAPSTEGRLSPAPAYQLDLLVAHASKNDEPRDPRTLGRLRLAMLAELSRLPDDESYLADDKIEALASYASLAYASVSALAALRPSRTLLWNEDLDPVSFIRRTLLIADHILVPDRLYSLAPNGPTNAQMRHLASRELEYSHLIQEGYVLMVPDRAAAIVASEAAMSLARADLANKLLVEFVDSQMVLEGPTRREALFVNAIDDFERSPFMWLHAHVEPKGGDDGSFRTKMLGPFDPSFDYRPWIEQVRRDAVAKFVQRTDERLAVADMLGASYVAASPFEARMLSRRSQVAPLSSASSAIWADVPALAELAAPDLVKLLQHEDAVEDLRVRVRMAVASAHSDSILENAASVADLSSDLEHAATKLGRQIRSDRSWAAIAPAALGASAMLIGAAGGLPAIAAGAIGAVGGIVPYIAARSGHRREASYLFMLAGRLVQRRKRR